MNYANLSLLSVAALLAACPRTDPTEPSIDAVEPVNSIEVPQFTLDITGHGFGLADVSYNVGTGEGQAGQAPLRIEILSRDGTPPGAISRISTTIVSPTLLSVTVDLAEPLPSGEYTVRLYQGSNAEPAATKTAAFEVPPSTGTPRDAGVLPGMDAAPVPGEPDASADAAAVSPGDDAAFADAATAPDADPVADSGVIAPPDAGTPADSGLGPFPAGPTFRRSIALINDTGLASPVDITVRIPVPHAAMLAAGQTTATGEDLAVYLGPTQLPHQIEDRGLLGTDRLELIVRLTVAIPAGPSMNLPLALYSDPLQTAAAPRTDAVYLFAEHFDLDFAPFTGQRNQWNDRWENDCSDRLRMNQPQSRCRVDSEGGLTRRSLASPAIPGMTNAPPANERYEVVAFIGGAMQTTNDLLYFAYGPDNESFHLTTILPDGAYDPAFVPNATLVFQETTNANRTARGYRFPAGAGTPFTRMRVTFVPSTASTHLHFRYVSADNQTSNMTVVGVDDLVVRRALSPDFRVLMGPAERR